MRNFFAAVFGLLFLFGPSLQAGDDRALEDALEDLGAKRYEEAAEKLESIRNDLESSAPRSPRLAEVLFYEAEAHYLAGEKYRAHLLYREILDNHKSYSRLAEAISREYEIGTAFIEGKAEKPFLKIFRTKSRSLGVEILSYLIENFEEKYFDYAQYLIADYFFKDGDWRRASDAYLRIEEDFPGSVWVPVAKFQRAVCNLKQFRGYRYDDTAARRAEEILTDYARKYKHGDRIEDAEALLAGIREDRAKLYLENAHFYSFRERRPRAALVYLEAIVREAGDSPAAKEAPRLLAKIAAAEEADPATASRARELAAEIERRRSISKPAEPAAAAAAPAEASGPPETQKAGAAGPGGKN
jgi:outer membrane protein assembly factor BamD (BamD/ComL family)